MLTELDQEKNQVKKLENSVRLCEEAISKAEKYERLEENKDWKEFWEDMKVVISLHDREITMACSMIPDAPSHPYIKHDDQGKETVVSSKADWADFISRHEIQRQELKNWIQEPDRIIRLAALAREKVPILKDRLKEYSRGPSETNGKS